MHIKRFLVSNYKSFPIVGEDKWDDKGICFVPGLNVVVGKNNSGKTALLEVLSLRFGNHPHRGTGQFSSHSDKSAVHVEFGFGERELVELVQSLGEFLLRVQRPSAPPLGTFQKSLLEALTIRCAWAATGITRVIIPRYGEVAGVNAKMVEVHIAPNDEVGISTKGGMTGGAPREEYFEFKLSEQLRRRLYFFSAQRPVKDVGPSQTSLDLAHDAANLPGALLRLLTTKRSRFLQLEDWVNRLFPDVKGVDVREIEDKNVRVALSPVASHEQRDDLLVDLGQSGTGIAQALAILYAIADAEQPGVILVDEPQSFLHPRAVRELIGIMQEHPEHQYILSTHSPTVIASAAGKTFHVVRKKGRQSTIETVPAQAVESLHAVLREVGARLSDVFGADRILWVEGRTEEECFRLIAARKCGPLMRGTAILGVVDTGPFRRSRKKYIQRVIKVYERLSQGPAFLPPAVGFIFDRENIADEEIKGLTQKHGQLHFIGRRMYENYLLNPEAIAWIASDIDGFRDIPVLQSEVEHWLDQHRMEAKYFPSQTPESMRRADDVWVKSVHGARFLKDLFADLSGKRVDYEDNKVAFGQALTNWLIENSPDDLEEVTGLLREVLTQPSRPTGEDDTEET